MMSNAAERSSMIKAVFMWNALFMSSQTHNKAVSVEWCVICMRIDTIQTQGTLLGVLAEIFA